MSGTWIKAPTFADDPARRAEVVEHTKRDKDHYMRNGMTELECRTCHALVKVKKNSSYHTSVQWTCEARAQCSELAKLVAAGQNPAMLPTCPRLSASIAHGVSEGLIPPTAPDVDPDGYY